MSFSYRRSFFIFGETLLLWLVSIPILGYAPLLRWLTQGDAGHVIEERWTLILIKAFFIPIACQVSYWFQDLYEWRVTSNRDEASVRLLRSLFYAGILLGLLNYMWHVVADFTERPWLRYYANNPWSTMVALVVVLPMSAGYRILFLWTSNARRLRSRHGNATEPMTSGMAITPPVSFALIASAMATPARM